jgi:hypothetical protein
LYFHFGLYMYFNFLYINLYFHFFSLHLPFLFPSSFHNASFVDLVGFLKEFFLLFVRSFEDFNLIFLFCHLFSELFRKILNNLVHCFVRTWSYLFWEESNSLEKHFLLSERLCFYYSEQIIFYYFFEFLFDLIIFINYL